MAFADMFKKRYTANAWCNNCNTHQEVQIPKGVSISQFVESGTGKCGNCGCNTLVEDYKQIDEFKRKPNQVTQKRGVPPIQPKREVAPIPEKRPSTKPEVYDESQYIDFTKPQPDFRLHPPEPQVEEEPTVFQDFDYWTGKPQRQIRRENREQKRGRR